MQTTDTDRLEFTQDWTKGFRKNFSDYVVPRFQDSPETHYLEIGVFEGRSGCHAISELPRLKYTGIDLWQPEGLSPIHYPDAETAVVEIERRARANLLKLVNDARILKGEATYHASSLMQAGEKFDIIYIDAAHFALNVMAEAAICWQMLKIGGVMIFDDYYDRKRRATTKTGGDAFLSIVHYKELFRTRQLGVVKTKECQSQPLYRVQKLGPSKV